MSSLNNLKYLYYSQGRFSDAEPLAVEVTGVRRRVLGDDRPETLSAIHNIERCYKAQVGTGGGDIVLESVAGHVACSEPTIRAPV